MRNDAGRIVRAGSLAVWISAILVALGAGSLSALQEDGCAGRRSLAVEVLDDSGLVPIPGATVALRWTDGERRPVREPVGADGRLMLCVPPDTRQAVLWAE